MVEEFNTPINAQETKVMTINCKGNGTPLYVNTDELQQEKGNEFCYHGSISRDGR